MMVTFWISELTWTASLGVSRTAAIYGARALVMAPAADRIPAIEAATLSGSIVSRPNKEWPSLRIKMRGRRELGRPLIPRILEFVRGSLGLSP
jgi:hypothetical protein